jgi:signal transduction histidine kinase
VRQHEAIKSAFIANVAYELRPPLAAVQMSLKNMDDRLLGSLTDPQHTTIRQCAEIVGRLSRMATDLIEITRSDKAKPTLQLDVLALQDLLREATAVLAPYLRAHHLTIDLHMPEQPVLFFGDRSKLLQAITGLIDHAVRWASEGSTVGLQLSQVVPEEWQLVVTHDIAGHQSDFARALDTYARLGGGVEEQLGLGLRLTKEIIELHHGRFWLEGEPGRSSRLMVNLPSLERQQLKSATQAKPT